MAWSALDSRATSLQRRRDDGGVLAINGLSQSPLLEFDECQAVCRERDGQFVILQFAGLRFDKFAGPAQLLDLRLCGVLRRAHLFVGGVKIPVVTIEDRDEGMLWFRTLEANRKGFYGTRLFWRSIVPYGENESSVTPAG